VALEWSLNGLRSLDRQMQRSVNLILETGKLTPKPVQNANEFNYMCSIAALIWIPVPKSARKEWQERRSGILPLPS